MNNLADLKYEQIILAIASVTSQNFVNELSMKDGLKAIDDLCWQVYGEIDEDESRTRYALRGRPVPG